MYHHIDNGDILLSIFNI